MGNGNEGGNESEGCSDRHASSQGPFIGNVGEG